MAKSKKKKNYRLKTNRAAAKRYKVLKSGKVKRKKGFLRHNLSTKTKTAKMVLGQTGYVSDVDKVHIRHLLPYG